MDIDWSSTPPLTALRAFEAAARLGNFSAAARSLNVTHAAVAQQVRSLEEHLGVSLMHRSGRGLALTAEGRQLAANLNEGFGLIQTGLRAITQGPGERPVRISLSPGFAAQWLMPRLRYFWANHPDVPLLMLPDSRVVDLRREGMDLAIRYGQGQWPGVEAQYLTSARFVITAAPSLIEGRPAITPEMMEAMPWIIATDWPEQRNWMASIGLNYDKLRRTEFLSEELALAAARQGLGLLVESHALVEDDLKSGRLRLVRDNQEALPAYFTVTLPGPQRRPVRSFLNWLLSAA